MGDNFITPEMKNGTNIGRGGESCLHERRNDNSHQKLQAEKGQETDGFLAEFSAYLSRNNTEVMRLK
jgi:hypothetical protein